MGWTAPRRHQCAKMVVVNTPSEGKPSMGKSIGNLTAVTRVGLDLAKNVFQVHAVDAKGEVVVARKLTRGRLVGFLRRAAAVRGGDGGVLVGAPLGAAIAGARARGEADPAGACENRMFGATRTTRRTRRRFARRRAAGPEVRGGALDRQPGGADAPSGARTAGRPAHGAAERAARPPGRDRRRRAAGARTRLRVEAPGREASTRTARSSFPNASARAAAAERRRSTRSTRRSQRSTRSLRRP